MTPLPKAEAAAFRRRRVDSHEAAEITGYAHESLANMRCKNEGPPYYKIGKKVVYDLAELKKWMQERRIVPVA